MAKKPRNPKVDFAAYLAIRLAVGFLQTLPLRMALDLGAALGWLAYKVDRRHRNVAAENLRHALPERCSDPAECDRLVRGCFRHFCTMVVEIACLPRRIHTHNWRRFGHPQGFDQIVEHLLGDRPVLIVTAHFGNWEVAGYATGVVGLRTYAIARVLDNPYLEAYLKKFRQKTGQTILAKTGDFDRITAALESGAAIATLGDQDAGPRGLFVNFFNRPASTHKAVALMSLQFDAPMLVIGIPRIGTPMKFALELEDVIDPREYSGGRADAVRAMTVRFTEAIERMARRHPEQYFWLHRRWKHQPPPPKGPRPPASSTTTL